MLLYNNIVCSVVVHTLWRAEGTALRIGDAIFGMSRKWQTSAAGTAPRTDQTDSAPVAWRASPCERIDVEAVGLDQFVVCGYSRRMRPMTRATPWRSATGSSKGSKEGLSEERRMWSGSAARLIRLMTGPWEVSMT